MLEKISILKESGDTLNSNVVSVFMVPDTQKRYLISTENTVDPHGLTVLHVSEIVDGALQKVATDEEWSSIKTIMRAIISGNVGSYQYLQTLDNIKANAQYSRDISVSASAVKQMIDNYATRDVNSIQPAVDVAPEAAIFPNGGTNDGAQADEVVPGVSVVETPSVETAPAVETSVVAAPIVEAPVVSEQTVVPNDPEVVAPVESVAEVAPVQEPIVPAPVEAVASPVVVEPHMVASSPVTLPDSEPVVIQAPEQPTMVSQMDLSVAPAPQGVPSAQIAQEAQTTPITSIKFDTSINASFAPDASLEEVVLASQEMFMEGVKNLVQTIQEKVYRDLYNKEAELKAKEEMLNQREKMLNEQMAVVMNNFSSMQGKVETSQPAAPPSTN